MRLVVLSVLLATLPGIGAVAQEGSPSPALNVLERIPDTAPFTVIIPNPRALSDRLAAMNESLGLQMDELADVLTDLLSRAGLTGVDETAPALLYFPSQLSVFTGNFVLLIPVTDIATFTGGSMEPVAPIALFEQTAYARLVDGYAIVALSQSTVETYRPDSASSLAGELGSLNDATLAESDLLLLVNFPGMPMFRSVVQEGIGSYMELAGSAHEAAGGGEGAAVLSSMLGLYSDAISAVMSDSGMGVVGIDIDEAGLGLTASTQFREGSDLAQLFTTGAGTGGQLSALPDESFIFALAVNNEGIEVDAILEDILDTLPEGGSGMASMLRTSFSMMSGVSALTAVFYTPDDDSSESGFRVLSYYHSPDIAALQTRFRAYYGEMDGLSFPVGPFEGPAGELIDGTVTLRVEYRENSSEIDGVSVDRYVTQQELAPDLDPETAALYGLGGYSGLVAATTDRLITATTTDDDQLREALRIIAEGGGIGERSSIGELRAHALVPHPSVEAYVEIGHIAAMLNDMFASDLLGTAIAIPTDAPPIAFYGHVLDNGAAFRAYVPFGAASLIQRVLDLLTD
jgi:hypothetical protein